MNRILLANITGRQQSIKRSRPPLNFFSVNMIGFAVTCNAQELIIRFAYSRTVMGAVELPFILLSLSNIESAAAGLGGIICMRPYLRLIVVKLFCDHICDCFVCQLDRSWPENKDDPKDSTTI